jgi:anti-anti-sigma regulatory factor
LEEELPSVERSQNAVAIINMRGREALGSTLLEVFERYATDLRVNGNKLILAEVKRSVRDQLERTNQVRTFRRANIYLETERYGESILDAYHDAQDWIEGKLR